MATQFRDGKFSETKFFSEALKDFQDFAESGRAVALHIGTELEIEEVKRKVELSSRVDDIESKLEEISADKMLESLNILKPTISQIEFLKDK